MQEDTVAVDRADELVGEATGLAGGCGFGAFFVGIDEIGACFVQFRLSEPVFKGAPDFLFGDLQRAFPLSGLAVE